MKPTKLILIFFLACSLLPVACCLLFAADLQVESGGKLKTDTFTFNEQATAPAHKASGGGRVYYDNRLYISDGTDWNDIEDAKTVATRIVGVDRSGDGVAQAGDSNLVGKTADYICDGTADNVKIQQAIDSLGSNGGAVYLLEGTYNVSASINMKSNVALIGAGAATLLNVTGPFSEPKATIYALSSDSIFISQLRLLGNGFNVDGIILSGLSNSKIQGVSLEGFSSGGNAAINTESGVQSNNVISGCHFINDNYGIILYDAVNNIISGNSFSNVGSGVMLGLVSAGNTVSGNNINSNSGITLNGNGVDGNTISGNVISVSGVGIKLIGLSAVNDYQSGNTISGNCISGSQAVTTVAIELKSTRYNIVSNNIASGVATGISLNTETNNDCSNNVITGNNIYQSSNYGILVTRTGTNKLENNLISYNRIYNPDVPGAGASYGIWIPYPEASRNYLVSNYIDGLRYTGAGYDRRISDSGTNTKYTGKDKLTLEPVTFTSPASAFTKIDLSSAGTGPTTYIQLNPSSAITLGNPAIDDGKAAGDMLILENISTNPVTITDNTNVQLYDNSSRTLGTNDTLKLIFNSTDWLEVSFADN